jgi:hypothetical protein
MPTPKAILAAVVVIFASTAAFGHPLPKTASPAPNAVLSTSPAEIRIGFSEKLVAAFSGLELNDSNGHPVKTGPATVNPNDKKELVAPIKVKLVPGLYTVMWHAVAADTHRVKGHYSFQVKP